VGTLLATVILHWPTFGAIRASCPLRATRFHAGSPAGPLSADVAYEIHGPHGSVIMPGNCLRVGHRCRIRSVSAGGGRASSAR
jgi:hypothetical protein